MTAVVLVAVLAAMLEYGLLMVWQGNAYWAFSGGVYAESARELLHGLVPYRDFAAAQPPPVFMAGALLLALSDTARSLQVGLGLVDLVTAGLVCLCVWRIEGRLWLAIGAAAAAPLLVISLNTHAQLVPETLAAPLVLGGALLSARRDRAWIGGFVLALAVWCKVAFLIPAVTVAIAAQDRRRTLAALLCGSIILFAGSIVVFGWALWRQTVTAQLQVGRATLHYAGGLLAQMAWNELPLAIGAVYFLVVAARRSPRGPAWPLVRAVGGAALGGLLLAFTVFKRGSYVDVMVVAEPPLLVLAVCGAASAWRSGATPRLVATLAAVTLAAQSASLLLHPSDPWFAVRPFAKSGLGWAASPSAVNHLVHAAKECPTGRAYSGSPYIAFLASRRMPGWQPDIFILYRAREDAAFAQKAAQDQPRCP